MKAVKRTMMAAAVGMVLAAPAWAAGHVEGERTGVTTTLTFKDPAPEVALTVSAHTDKLLAGNVAESTPLADVTVTDDDKGLLAVAWTKTTAKQVVNPDGIGAVITANDSSDTLKVKLNMGNGAKVHEVGNQQWVTSAEPVTSFAGTIDAGAGNTDVKAGTYTVSLDGAVYSE